MSALSGSRKTAVLVIVLASYAMLVIDVSIVITALPKIRDSFGLSATSLSWVHNAYTLVFGGLLLLGARVGDLFGRRRLFIVGIGVFTVASLLVATAQSAAWLIAARALQGVGAAILAPSTLALLTTSFSEGPERTRAVGYYGAAVGIGGSIGLIAGGLFTDWLSWRAAFGINVPLGIAMMLVAPHVLPETARRTRALDLAGAMSSTLGMTALVYGLVRSASDGWSDPVAIASFVIGFGLLVLFIVNERRVEQPLIPLHLFGSRERVGAYAARMCFLASMLPFWFFTTQYLQGVLGFSPTEAGLAFLPTTVVNLAVALAVPRLTQRLGNARLITVGIAVALVGMAWLGRVSADSSYLTGVALPMLLIGGGQGACSAPLAAAGIAGVAPDDAGAGSGVFNVAHQIGGSLGLAILVAVFAAADSSTLHGGALLAHRISASITGGALLLALAATFSLLVRARRHAHTELAATAA
jgi:EmrB/QacA subfamily drug resistance transporter